MATATWIPAIRLATDSPFASWLITSCSAKTVQVLLICCGSLGGKGKFSKLRKRNSKGIGNDFEKPSCSGGAFIIHDKVGNLAVLDLDALAVLAAYIDDWYLPWEEDSGVPLHGR